MPSDQEHEVAPHVVNRLDALSFPRILPDIVVALYVKPQNAMCLITVSKYSIWGTKTSGASYADLVGG